MLLSQEARGLAPERGVVVVAGLAGCGKTELLHALARDGEQILDLEALASHRGSAFGGFGLPAQPSHQEFERAVRGALAAVEPERVLWVEDEGPFIGQVGLPLEVVDRVSRAPIVELRASLDVRVQRILAIVGPANPTDLVAAISRSVDRVGAPRAAAAAAHVRSGNLSAAVQQLLPAYDEAYAQRMAQRRRELLGVLEAA
jgi:tRNA 2-selenouridine synthase